MTTDMRDKAFVALCERMGDATGWEQIEPVRRRVPVAIQRLERQLVEAEEALDQAVTVHEQARTDASLENLFIARERVSSIAAKLDETRAMFYQHPEYFDDEEA